MEFPITDNGVFINELEAWQTDTTIGKEFLKKRSFYVLENKLLFFKLQVKTNIDKGANSTYLEEKYEKLEAFLAEW